MQDNDFKFLAWRYSGWVLIIAACAVPLVGWLALAPLGDRFAGWAALFASIGRVTGLIGFVLYAINLLLSSRMRWLEHLFGGLNRVYIAHHITGGIALCLLLFHPLFLALRYVDIAVLSSLQTAARQLLPHSVNPSLSFAEVQEAAAFNAGIIAFIGMVVLLFITFFAHLPYRLWLFTHRFLGVAFAFAGVHVLFISSDVSRHPWLFAYYAGWLLVGIGCFVYRSILGNVFVKRAPYHVDKVYIVDDSTVAVEMSPIQKPIQFTPGQFVFIRFKWSTADGIIEETHPFSIASAPGEKTLRLFMKALGDYTTSLKHLKEGTVAEIEGAFGKFSYTYFGDTPQLWIAGGIGITPFLSMARSYTAQSPAVDLFYSVVKREELLDQAALADFLPQHYSQFHYHPYIVNEQPTFLNAQYIVDQTGPVAGKEIFLCGPPPMMKALRAQFRAMGVPNYKIHSEEFTMQ